MMIISSRGAVAQLVERQKGPSLVLLFRGFKSRRGIGEREKS